LFEAAYNSVTLNNLPPLRADQLAGTRGYLRDIALALGSLQRAFLPRHPRFWQYGLEVSMRGFSTQSFVANGGEQRVLADLVKSKLRLDGQNWLLADLDGRKLFKRLEAWAGTGLEKPEFAGPEGFDDKQAAAYAAALWWLEEQFRRLKTEITEGVTSPILLYPHHFDLAMSWFPYDDDRQLTIGWSTGDDNVTGPYLYITAYPEPAAFKQAGLPAGAAWQSQGFSGAVLPYAGLQSSRDPAGLFGQFAGFFKRNPWQ
jgi:uncharacterized protein DUF5996